MNYRCINIFFLNTRQIIYSKKRRFSFEKQMFISPLTLIKYYKKNLKNLKNILVYGHSSIFKLNFILKIQKLIIIWI